MTSQIKEINISLEQIDHHEIVIRAIFVKRGFKEGCFKLCSLYTHFIFCYIDFNKLKIRKQEMKRISGQQVTTTVQKTPLVSIIVPVYQVKDYVGECVESLLAQTYANLEILLVDDGSTDGSGALCDEYAAKGSRVRVIHQENQGLSAARNTGIELATGEYVAFVDSDDMVLPDFIETLYKLLRKYQADIALCGYVKCRTEDLAGVRNELSSSGKERCMTSTQMLRQWHGKYKKWETVAWNKLYRRSVLEGREDNSAMHFPIGRRHEDVLTSHLFVANATRVVMTMRKLYLYRIRPGSITDQSIMTEFKEENLRAQRERMAFFKERRYWRAYLNLFIGYVLHWAWFRWRRISNGQ